MGLASALAKGLNGYTEGLKYKDRLERQAKEDAWTEEQRNNQRAEWASADKQRAALSEAVRPAQVDAGQVVTDDAGSNAFTKDADAAAMMQDMAAAKNEGAGLSSATRVNQTAYTDPAKATQAASTYNSPVARTERMSAAVMPFDPTKGISLANTGLQMQKAQTEAEQKLAERAKMIKAEGVGDVYKGMLAKDPQAIADGFNKTGELKIDGLPKLVQTRKVKTPYGEVDDDVWEATVTGADGKKRTIRQSTHQVGAQLYEVKDLLKDQSTAAEIGLRHSNSMKEIGARGVQERQTAGYKESIGGGEGGKAPSGYRWTNGGGLEPIPGGPGDKPGGLSSMDRMLIDGRANAARQDVRAIEDQLASGTMPFVTEKSPQWAEKQRLTARLQEATAEYQKWSGLLSTAADASGQKIRQPGLSSATPAPTPGAAPRNMSLRSTTAETDVPAILGAELKKAIANKSADADSIRREIDRLPASQKQAALAAAGSQGAGSQSPKVASLPQGAKQIGTSGGKPVYETPDGKKFIQQ